MSGCTYQQPPHGWTYNEDRDKILDQDGFAPDITTEQWRTLLHFIATHGPAIVAGRDPVAEAERERDEALTDLSRLRAALADQKALVAQISGGAWKTAEHNGRLAAENAKMRATNSLHISADQMMPDANDRSATIAAIEDIEALATAGARKDGPVMPETPSEVVIAAILRSAGDHAFGAREAYHAIRAALAKEQQS